MTSKTILELTKTVNDESLYQLSENHTVLLVFLRHFGCIFCKEAMNDIAKKRSYWEKLNVKTVFVHMAEKNRAEEFFAEFGLKGVDHISDPNCMVYKNFGLSKGGPSQLFGLKGMLRGFEVAVKHPSYLGGAQIGDGLQMPGVFLICDGQIVDSYIHRNASDRPNYDEIISNLNGINCFFNFCFRTKHFYFIK